MERQTEEVEEKVKGMIVELKKLTPDNELGICASEARILIYEKCIVPSITFNLEMWTKIKEKGWERIERIQSKALKVKVS